MVECAVTYSGEASAVIVMSSFVDTEIRKAQNIMVSCDVLRYFDKYTNNSKHRVQSNIGGHGEGTLIQKSFRFISRSMEVKTDTHNYHDNNSQYMYMYSNNSNTYHYKG